jgi:tungstate transport system ATP-binding protein
LRGEVLYELGQVVKVYGNREVCHISHLEIYKGEIFGVMGPSGAGKSTFLRLLNFLEPPTEGVIRFKGIAIDSLPPLELRRQITMVFQESLLLNTTVEGNITYGLKLRRQPVDKRKLREIMEKVGLTPLAKALSPTLSAGEKQRVALARALILEPEVLLLDEPTANLDPYNVTLIEEIISRVNREGTTIVIVTHNVFQARRLCHRAMLMLDGKVVEVGEIEQIFSRPHDPRTSAFIRGEMVY